MNLILLHKSIELMEYCHYLSYRESLRHDMLLYCPRSWGRNQDGIFGWAGRFSFIVSGEQNGPKKPRNFLEESAKQA